jgi:hypothetical protein
MVQRKREYKGRFLPLSETVQVVIYYKWYIDLVMTLFKFLYRQDWTTMVQRNGWYNGLLYRCTTLTGLDLYRTKLSLSHSPLTLSLWLQKCELLQVRFSSLVTILAMDPLGLSEHDIYVCHDFRDPFQYRHLIDFLIKHSTL